MQLIAKLSEQERRELFSETATAMNITPTAVEKDFWICWVLLKVFEDPQLKQCLRFKGGTSLSKCYGAIERFSEDIDLILDWTHLSEQNPTDTRSKTQQNKLNGAINAKAQEYIADTILPCLDNLVAELCTVSIDESDPHTINITYPKAFDSEYLRPQVRLEIGPLAAMLPMEMRPVTPYAAQQFPSIFQQTAVAVPTIVAARTFWEKLTILHAEAHRPANKPLPNRYARHYYDVYKLVTTGVYTSAMEQAELLSDVVAFKQKFYPSGWANYGMATLSEIVLQPSQEHLTALKRDYEEMQEMLFGIKPRFDDIVAVLTDLEQEIRKLKQ